MVIGLIQLAQFISLLWQAVMYRPLYICIYLVLYTCYALIIEVKDKCGMTFVFQNRSHISPITDFLCNVRPKSMLYIQSIMYVYCPQYISVHYIDLSEPSNIFIFRVNIWCPRTSVTQVIFNHTYFGYELAVEMHGVRVNLVKSKYMKLCIGLCHCLCRHDQVK